MLRFHKKDYGQFDVTPSPEFTEALDKLTKEVHEASDSLYAQVAEKYGLDYWYVRKHFITKLRDGAVHIEMRPFLTAPPED